MQWMIKTKTNPDNQNSERAIVEAILHQRGLHTDSEIESFLNPDNPITIDPENTGIDISELQNAVKIISTAIADNRPIIVYGDYDADGITATAIMWETLHNLGAKAYPFIPSRELHGYGLSIKGLEDALSLVTEPPLIVTVDNGIVANQEIEWIKRKGLSVIITDHHQPSSELPEADAIVHTTSLCGAGVAWMIANTMIPDRSTDTLDLACIGTISDMMPLTGANRSLVKYGLMALQQTHRPGIKALLSEAKIDVSDTITPYHINYVIAPRLNAMGRLEHALDSLRLICTTNTERAAILANTLGSTNRDRQDLTQELLDHAKELLLDFESNQKIIVLDDSEFHEGVIGLIAGKLVESYYRPAIVICRKAGISKASARSITGVNITELIRAQSDFLEGVGGHPMAAGFSIQTEKIEAFKAAIIASANQTIHESQLVPMLPVDIEVDFDDITESLDTALSKLQPFGIGNPQPVIAVSGVVKSSQPLGKEGKHLKIILSNGSTEIPVIWFGHGESLYDVGSTINVAATMNLNSWRGRSTLQLLAKDIVSI